MVQRYTEIPSSQKIAESLSLILNNDKTAISHNSGSAFPTTNLQLGMTCYRTDEEKLYELRNIEEQEWACIADLSGNFRHIEGGQGNLIPYTAKDLNIWSKMPTGFYEGSKMLHAPEGDEAWRVLHLRTGNSDGYATQMAFGQNTDLVMVRYQKGGTWSAWKRLFVASTDGSTIEGMNAEMLNGLTPGNTSGQIPVNNGKLSTNLNADKVDGFDAGNKANQVPISNATLNVSLNADLLDGMHAGHEAGQIPINDGTLNKNLNAEKLNGFTVDNFVVKSQGTGEVTNLSVSNNTTTKTIRVNDVNGITALVSSNPDGNSLKATRYTTAHDYGNNAYDTYEDVTGSTSGYYTSDRILMRTVRLWTGSGNYNVSDMLRTLIQYAHRHEMVKQHYRFDCRCACNCECNCGDDSM